MKATADERTALKVFRCHRQSEEVATSMIYDLEHPLDADSTSEILRADRDSMALNNGVVAVSSRYRNHDGAPLRFVTQYRGRMLGKHIRINRQLFYQQVRDAENIFDLGRPAQNGLG